MHSNEQKFHLTTKRAFALETEGSAAFIDEHNKVGA